MNPVMPNTQRLQEPPWAAPMPIVFTADARVVTEWQLSAEDLATVLQGGRVRLWIQTEQPVRFRMAIEVIE